MQLLLGVKDQENLLKIVFELTTSLVGTRGQVIEHFRNLFTVDILLKMFEEHPDKDL